MKKNAVDNSDASRLSLLNELQIWQSQNESEYDALTSIASQLCNTPISLITFIDDNSQWAKSSFGTDLSVIDRKHAFCNRTIQEPHKVFEVEDASKDQNFKSNPLVIGEPYIRFYAGVPILLDCKAPALGAICVIDTKPNKLTDKQKITLQNLSKQVSALLNLRKQNYQLNEALTSLNKFSKIVDTVNESFVITDANRKVEWVNDGFTKTTGFSLEEVKGKNLKGFLQGPLTNPDHNEAMRKGLQSKKPFVQEIINYHKNGDHYWVEVSISPELDENGNVLKFFAIQKDITERKKAQESLALSQLQLSNIANSVPGVLLEYNVHPDGSDSVSFISDTVKELWEVPKEEALNDVGKLWGYIQEDDIEEMARSVQDSAENLSFWNHFYRIKTKSNKIKWVNGRGMPIRKTDGTITWNTLIIEVTALIETEKSLELALAHKNTLLRELHHRIKNNLQLIISILRLKYSIEESDEIKEFIKSTSQRISSIAKIYNHLLIFEENNSLDVKSYLESLSHEIVANMSGKSDPFQLDLDVEEHPFTIDKIMCIGLITNELISNSIKYAYDEGEAGQILVRFKKTSKGFLFEIGDFGKAKNQKMLSNNKSLGLILVQSFVSELGGNFTTDTTEGLKYSIRF